MMANFKSKSTAEEDPLTGLKKPRKTLCELLVETKNNTTVEPIAFVMIISSMLSIITTQTLGLEKVCRVNLRLGNEICNSLRAKNSDSSNTSHYEKAVQEYIAVRIAWRSVIQYTLPSILLLFIGGWSDMTGKRKIFMILPLMGEICQCCSNMINVIFFNQLPVEVLMIFDALCFSVCGGWSVMFHAIFCYICDVSTLENRTYRLGLVNFFAYVGIPIGMAFSGVILRNFGYFAIYGLSLTMHLCNLFYIIFKLPNEKRTLNQKSHDGRGFLYFVRSFFDLNNVKDTLSVVFKKAPKNRRARLIILLCVICILFGPMYGEVAIMYMSTRYRFNWDEVKFSIFQTYNFVTHTIGTIFSILVFSKYLKWHDSILGIISTISKIVGSFVYCFAPNDKIFFLAPLVEILNGTSLLAMRSIFSKLVAPNELGKVNSIIGLTENLMPLLYVPLYTKVYTATMEVLPGAVFLMGASMTFPAVCVFIWLLYEHRKGLKKERTRNTVE